MKANLLGNKRTAGKWDHDVPGNYGGSSGSYSRYTDGVQSVLFYLDVRKQKWMYEAMLSRSDKAPGYSAGRVVKEVPEQYAPALDEGNITVMTGLANKILKRTLKESMIKTIVAQILKEASFPKILLSLPKETRANIARVYSVGPKSEQQEIDIANVTRKPYSDQLLIYTVPEIDEDAKQNESYKRRREFENAPEYQDIRGSRAGEKWLKEKIDALEAELKQKYSMKEKIVAYAVGTQFTSLRGYRSFYNRKNIIDYVKARNGKVYAISVDYDVAKARAEHQKFRPGEEATVEQQIKARGTKLLKSKLPQLEALLDEELAKAKVKMLENIELNRKTQVDMLDSVIQNSKTEHYHKLDSLPNVSIHKDVDTRKIERLKEWVRKAQSGWGESFWGSKQEDRDAAARKALVQLIKTLDELLK